MTIPSDGSRCIAVSDLPRIMSKYDLETRFMFRAALAIYLMFVAALGPGLCCCTLSQLLHQECQASTTNAPAQPKKSCCHHGHDGQPGNSKEPSTPASCPCKNHQNIPVAPVLQNLTIASLVLEFAFDHQLLLDFQSVLSVSASASVSVTSMSCIGCLHISQFSAQDILRAPFVLLC